MNTILLSTSWRAGLLWVFLATTGLSVALAEGEHMAAPGLADETIGGVSPHVDTEGHLPPVARSQAHALINPLEDTIANRHKGRLLFGARCQVCHAPANQDERSGFQPPPQDFDSSAFQQVRTDGDLFWVIKFGVDGTAMLPWASRLADREIWLLVSYIRTLAPQH